MESDYGRVRGTRDIVRTLATLAYTRPDRPVFRDELIAALVILQRGAVPPERLVGSWAGAMGDPQFLPSAYLKYAVSAGRRTAPPTFGPTPPTSWRPSPTSCGMEGLGARPTLDRGRRPARRLPRPDPPRGGHRVGAARVAARGWAAARRRGRGGAVPAGRRGRDRPSCCSRTTFVIKQYNNSDAYALSLGVLARRIAGAGPIATPWPARPVVVVAGRQGLDPGSSSPRSACTRACARRQVRPEGTRRRPRLPEAGRPARRRLRHARPRREPAPVVSRAGVTRARGANLRHPEAPKANPGPVPSDDRRRWKPGPDRRCRSGVTGLVVIVHRRFSPARPVSACRRS